MTREQLQTAARWFRADERRLTALKAANAFCVGSAVAAFAWGLLIRPGFTDPKLTLRLALTCGIPFVLLSAARRVLDRPRPFEVYALEPLLPREKRGRSFPSRHVFSICVIGTCFCYLQPPIGFALLGLGAVLSVLRVVSAVHFPRDVIAGACAGIAAGILGFGIL